MKKRIILATALTLICSCKKEQPTLPGFKKPIVSVKKVKNTAPKVARLLIAEDLRDEEWEDGTDVFQFYTIYTNGRKKKKLGKTAIWDLGGNNEVFLLEERNWIIYSGRPHKDSTHGLWAYNYKKDTSFIFHTDIMGMSISTISEDRTGLYFMKVGTWHYLDFETGSTKELLEVKYSGGIASKMHPDGTRYFAATRKKFYIYNIKTEKIKEWKFDKIQCPLVSENLANLTYIRTDSLNNDYFYLLNLENEGEQPVEIFPKDIYRSKGYLLNNGKVIISQMMKTIGLYSVSDTVIDTMMAGYYTFSVIDEVE